MRSTQCTSLVIPSFPRISAQQLSALLRAPWNGIADNLRVFDASSACYLPAKGWVALLNEVRETIECISLPDVHRSDLEILVGDWKRYANIREIEVADAQSLSGSCARFHERFPLRPPPPVPPPTSGQLKNMNKFYSKKRVHVDMASPSTITTSTEELQALGAIMDTFLSYYTHTNNSGTFTKDDEEYLKEWCDDRSARERTAIHSPAAPGIRVLRLNNASKAKNTTIRPLLMHAGATLECVRITGAKMVDSKVFESHFGNGLYKDEGKTRWANYWNGDFNNFYNQLYQEDDMGKPLLCHGSCNRGYIPCVELRELTFAQCGHVYEEEIGFILDCGSRLEWLDLSWSPSVGNTSRTSGWWSIPLDLPCLRTLILDQCQYLSDASLYNIISSAPNLHQLSLRGCGLISDFSLKCLIAPKGSTHLSTDKEVVAEHPSKQSTIDMTAGTFYEAFASKLRSLDLRHTRVTGAFVKRAEMVLPKLSTLILDGCRGVSRDMRKRIRESSRFCNGERGKSMFAFPPEGTGSVLHNAVRQLINKKVRERSSGSHTGSPVLSGVPADSRWHNSKARSSRSSNQNPRTTSTSHQSSSVSSSSSMHQQVVSRIGPASIDAMVEWEAGDSDDSCSSESDDHDDEDWGPTKKISGKILRRRGESRSKSKKGAK